MTKDVRHSSFKTGLIVDVLPIVVTKAMLIEVAKQMEWLNANVGSADTALEQAPEVLKAVGVDAAIDVLNSMVYNLVSILPASPSYDSRASV